MDGSMVTAFCTSIFFSSSHNHDVVWPILLLATVRVNPCSLLAEQVFLLR